MNRRSIRFRPAGWHSAVLALALVAFGVVSWREGVRENVPRRYPATRQELLAIDGLPLTVLE